MMQNDPDTASKNIMRHSSGVERTALTGVGITDSSPTYGYGYWMFMIAIFGVTSIALGIFESRGAHDQVVREVLMSQIIDWHGFHACRPGPLSFAESRSPGWMTAPVFWF
ncbi:MAG: hypothetical protein DSY87_04910 [Methylococcus sp.]|nr:MAG: hypothetical protein DSY87_04910 [Methylococcus sp.]